MMDRPNLLAMLHDADERLAASSEHLDRQREFLRESTAIGLFPAMSMFASLEEVHKAHVEFRETILHELATTKS
jgi:hypothetical protein